MGKINDVLPKKQERKKLEKEKKRQRRVRKKKGRTEKRKKRKKKEKGKEAQSFGGTTDAVAEGLGLLEATA